MTLEEHPGSHKEQYDKFHLALRAAQPALAQLIAATCQVEWGNSFANGPTGPDTLLSRAESNVGALVRTHNVSAHPGPLNVLAKDWDPLSVRAKLFGPIREKLVQFGLADAVYYASSDGEADVRSAVYGQILGCLRAFTAEPDVRLHLIAHSLGVTVAHDFLYGLFGSNAPDYLKQDASIADREAFALWRMKIERGELRVGSFTAMASQLPLFVLRKRRLVQQLNQGKPLDPRDIGIGRDDRVRWLFVYDVDDVLGFATRELYGNAPSIKQVQIDCGDSPVTAHTGYWEDEDVIREAAQLISARARD
jgi:hypothetical protein